MLRDWDAEGERMRRIADVFDDADEVRISGAGTDLTSRSPVDPARSTTGHVNMPGGEVFYSPVEDSATGTIEFSEFPAVYSGHEVEGVRLVFERGHGRRGDGARSGEEFLMRMLDTDEGARRLGELGIGCNPGIQRFMKNIAFDEKIDGTVHLAVGNSYTFTGGTNKSAIHWDIVKDLRNGGRLYADGRLVQANGPLAASDAGGRDLAGEPRVRRRSGRGSPRSVRPPLSRCRYDEHERRHRLAVDALRPRLRRARARSAARRRRGSRRAAGRAAGRRRRAPSAPRAMRAASSADSTRAETAGPPRAA